MNTDLLPDYDIPWKPIGREPAPADVTTTGEPCDGGHVITVTSISTWGSTVSKFAVCALLFLGACSSPTEPSTGTVLVAGGLSPTAPQQSDYAMGAN